MATLLRVPEVAAGATEVVLSEWLVEENASFSTGDPIVVLETEKAVVEVEAESDATILRALVTGGTTVEVGSPMALIGDASEVGSDLDQALAGLGFQAAPERPTAARRDVPEPSAPMAATHAAPEPETAPEPEVDPRPAHSGGHSGGRVFASPIARRVLREAGLDVSEVQGTGPNGRIVRRDAEQAIATRSAGSAEVETPGEAESQPPIAAKVPAPAGDSCEVPHTRLRRAVASRLTESKQSIPHFYLKRAARIDALLDLRAQLNEVSGQRISVNDLVIRAVAAAHVEVPEANVIWTDESMRVFDTVDISVAIASDRGLVTPVLRGVENSSPAAIAKKVKTFVQQANDGKLQQRDLEGGSISVTNLGMFGVDEFAAIINPPQSAILAVGAGQPQPVVVDGALAVATVMTLVLSVDHRAIDGALAARWMAALVDIIERPLRILV
jgi:pyruvate dehydrogenase E2 component (dihydrolipoamide acetyltransferase)